MSSRGPEGKYIDKIHRQLSQQVYKMKMNMGMGSPGGVPDYYYEGNRGILWVEYKVVKDWSKKHTVPFNLLSELQVEWLTRAHNNDRIIAVLIGDEKGNTLWLSGFDLTHRTKELEHYTLLSKKEAADKIKEYTICK